MIEVPIKIYTQSGILPTYAHIGDSGFDIQAYSPETDICIYPGDTIKIKTGLFFEIPKGWEIQIRPKSGYNARAIFAAYGTVDGIYRGEIAVVLHNATDERIIIKDKDKIAQGVIAPVYVATFVQVEQSELKQTDRGINGFGSTGV